MSSHTVYISTSELDDEVGGGIDTARLSMAIIQASRWCDYTVGAYIGDPELPIPTVPITDVTTLEVVPVVVSVHSACLTAASRFLRSPSIPFSAAALMGDFATRVMPSIPEAEMALLGQRKAWGFS
jgi:hypothetical protein